MPADSPAPDLPTALLVEALARAAAAARRAGRPFRVLEVGAGQGLLTRHLHPALSAAAGAGLEYVFTDLGRSFVLAAERRAAAAGWRGIRFGILDAGRDPAAQGFSPGAFDAVVAANVVHATPKIAETLGHLRSLLAPGGVLALVETVRVCRWNDLVWGLTEGWWSFADPELRDRSPLLAPAAWRSALAAAGFETPATLPADGTAGAGAALVAARRPLSAGAADDLSIAADPADPGHPAALAAAVAEARRRMGGLDGLFYAAPEGTSDLDTAVAAARALSAAAAGVRFVALAAGPARAAALAAVAGGVEAPPALALAWGDGPPGLPRLQAALATGIAGGLPLLSFAPPPAARAADGATVEGSEPGDGAVEPTGLQPAGFHDRPRLLNPYVAPRDEAEEEVAAIWRRALGIDRIGVDDNFLELGGDSLTGLQVAHAVQERWDLAGRSFSLYDTPTVAAIARFVTSAGAPGEDGAAREDRGAHRGERRRARRASTRRTDA